MEGASFIELNNPPRVEVFPHFLHSRPQISFLLRRLGELYWPSAFVK